MPGRFRKGIRETPGLPRSVGFHPAKISPLGPGRRAGRADLEVGKTRRLFVKPVDMRRLQNGIPRAGKVALALFVTKSSLNVIKVTLTREDARFEAYDGNGELLDPIELSK